MSQDEQNVKPTESELNNTQGSSLESSGSAQEPGNSASESNPSCSNNSEFLRILSRQEWGARDPVNPLVDLNRAVDFVVIHHSSRPRCFTMEDCIRAVRSYQNLHMDTNKWDDIGYSFVVGEDGNVYEGRGWNKHGAHSIPFNRNSIGICIIGDFVQELPNELALNTVRKLIERSIEKGYLSANYILKGHRDQTQLNGRFTECPGDALYEEIKKWPHFG